MTLNEATLPLLLYRKVIVRTSRHISIPCFITFSASAAVPFLLFLSFCQKQMLAWLKSLVHRLIEVQDMEWRSLAPIYSMDH